MHIIEDCLPPDDHHGTPHAESRLQLSKAWLLSTSTQEILAWQIHSWVPPFPVPPRHPLLYVNWASCCQLHSRSGLSQDLKVFTEAISFLSYSKRAGEPPTSFMDFSSGFEHAYAGMDFLAVPAPGKGVIEPVSQMHGFVLPALPDLLHEPGSSNLGSIAEGCLDCLTAEFSPTEDQSVPQSTEQAEAKYCQNCGVTEIPRWACLAQSV